MNRTLLQRALAAAGTVVVGVLALAGTAAAQSEAPPGNNGTIKIDDVLMDDGNENVPHPGCTFVIDFFGYDVGTRTASVSFDGQAPTGGGELFTDVFTFEVESRESGNELNTSRTVDLSAALAGIEPHPQQGWHVKLTVHVDGAQGADVKHKVFWVSDCAEIAPAEVAEPPVVETAEEAALRHEQAVAIWNAAVLANAQAAAAEAAAAQAAAERGAVLSASQEAGAAGELPRTGALTDVLAGMALVLLVAGTVLVRVGRRPAASC